VIEVALITAPSRANDLIFGRTLLERLLILCERAGVRHFVIEAPENSREAVVSALGSFSHRPEIGLVDSFTSIADGNRLNLDPASRCVRLFGNLVFAESHLRRALARDTAGTSNTINIFSADAEHGGMIMVGPLQSLLTTAPCIETALKPTGILPFALNGRPADREEAELRLARSIRDESLSTDSFMARAFDRRLSWQISLWLARARIAPNAITISNTILGFGCAAMLASTSYWMRLIGAIFFLVSITLDGVDGELARLRMVESKFGGKLDVFTDNLVHIAIFAGVMIGCYRVSHSHAYIYLSLLLLVGFGLCAVSVNRALAISGEATNRWISRVERATGRDFAYIVVVLAIINRLSWFAWGTAFGTYVFAITLWILTSRQLRRA
jgi:phosphatidylglycerophosphate synthase